MKNVKRLNQTLTAGAYFMILVAVCSIFGANVLQSLTCAAGIMVVSSLVPSASGILAAGVIREIWTGEVVKELNNLEKDTFLDGIPDYSRHVSAVGDEAQAIHLVYMGVVPDVLINNTTYPIPEQTLGESDIIIQLDKLVTKVTPVTDDELYALSYKKIQEVSNSHTTAMSRTKLQKSLHALAPSGNTADMPVLLTTGADDGTGRKMLTSNDLVALKRKLDNLKHDGVRRMVLCSDHENDLLLLDQKFKDQFYNAQTGKPFNYLGFEFRSYTGSPYYNPTTRAKLSFGAVPAGTDRAASVYFLVDRAAKAVGWTKFYFNEAKTNPSTQKNTMNYRHYFVVLPKREDGRGAIVSANV